MKTRRTGKTFVLGKCNCGCNKNIKLRTKRGYLARFVNGHSNPKVKYHCKRCKDQRWFIECRCGCGGILTLRDKFYEIREFVFGHHTKPMRFQKGDKNPMWKGGRVLDRGYWIILNPLDEHVGRFDYRYIREHIYIFQKHYQCCLLPWGEIHHKDGNKKNNKISNLIGLTASQHTTLHFTKDMSNRKCQFCHPYTVFTKNNIHWHKINGKWTCHRCYMKCYWKKKRNKK